MSHDRHKREAFVSVDRVAREGSLSRAARERPWHQREREGA